VDEFGWIVVGSVAGLVAALVAVVTLLNSLSNRRKTSGSKESESFVEGDASGSRFGNVYSNAPTFVRGNARRASFWNVTHRSNRH